MSPAAHRQSLDNRNRYYFFALQGFFRDRELLCAGGEMVYTARGGKGSGLQKLKPGDDQYTYVHRRNTSCSHCVEGKLK